MKYCQCICHRNGEDIMAFIESDGAKVGAMVEVFEKPGDLWKINAVLTPPMDINEVLKGPPYAKHT